MIILIFPRNKLLSFDVGFHFKNFPFVSVYLLVLKRTIIMANVSWVENKPKLREQTGLSASKSCVPGSKIESIGLPGTL